MAAEKLLEVRNLTTVFDTFQGQVRAVRGISYQVSRGEIVGIVGESGSGKTVEALSLIRLLPKNAKVSGEVWFDGQNLSLLSEKAMRRVRNNGIAMIFQDPMTSLNPTVRVCRQITERLRAFNRQMSPRAAREKALSLLEMVRIPDARQRLDAYPFEMSGGMRQRVMIACALACSPSLLIADEPTTALDVTIQNQILRLIRALRDETNASILLITHDLGVVAETCDRVLVMYGGMIMEEGTVDEIFYDTAHPYTMGLKRSIPDVLCEGATRLYSIPGSPPSLLSPPQGCPFAPRCPRAMAVCRDHLPPVWNLSDTHAARCWLHDPDCPDKAWKEGSV